MTAEDGWPCTQGHHDFLERRIARTFAEAVDRAFDLSSAGANTSERIGHGEPEIVMTVRRYNDALVAGGESADALDQRGVFFGCRVPNRVGDVERRRAGFERRCKHLVEKVGIGARGVFWREFDVFHV